MATRTGEKSPRYLLAIKRLRSVLSRHVVASDRILEQKISDAGPFNQRIDPHVLTAARRDLMEQGEILRVDRDGSPWYYLTGADKAAVKGRLAQLNALHRKTQEGPFTMLLGQALEIAVFRALSAQTALHYYGAFPDLDAHDDSKPYRKIEPPSFLSGRDIGNKNLDFLVHPVQASTIYAGIEVKNIRQWMYPDRTEIRELLLKCCTLDVVPVLIARRIQYSTFSVLNPCGVLMHQTYNQIYPQAAKDLGDEVKRKDLLGYHDVRVGNSPDARLLKFIGHDLAALLPAARLKFDQFKDLLRSYGSEDQPYKSFAARVKRRMRGESEDLPPPESEESEESSAFEMPDE